MSEQHEGPCCESCIQDEAYDVSYSLYPLCCCKVHEESTSKTHTKERTMKLTSIQFAQKCRAYTDQLRMSGQQVDMRDIAAEFGYEVYYADEKDYVLVEDHHIDHGTPRDCGSCAIALADRDALGGKNNWTFVSNSRVYRLNRQEQTVVVYNILPDGVGRQLRDFNDGIGEYDGAELLITLYPVPPSQRPGTKEYIAGHTRTRLINKNRDYQQNPKRPYVRSAVR